MYSIIDDIKKKLKKAEKPKTLNTEELIQINNLLVEVTLASDRMMAQKTVIDKTVQKIKDILKKP